MQNKNQFIIMKASRSHAGPVVTKEDAYTGPTCDRANVQPGKIYASEAAAKRDANKLSAINPVGFEAIGIGWSQFGGRWFKHD